MFHKLYHHATMILSTEKIKVYYFVFGLRNHLRVDTKHYTLFQVVFHLLILSTIPHTWIISIARPNGAAIRGNAIESATTYPILQGGNHIIGPARGSIRVSMFRRHYQLLRKANINMVVLVRASLRGSEPLPSYHD